MWQQGSFQKWPLNAQPNSNEVDWGALAQAWMQNKEMNGTSMPLQNNHAMVNHNGGNVPRPPFNHPHMQWAQQQRWPNHQWNNWNNSQQGGYNQQWSQPPVSNPVTQTPAVAPPQEDIGPPPPLPLLPEEESHFGMPVAPPGTLDDTDTSEVHITEQEHLPLNNNVTQFQEFPRSKEDHTSGYNTPPQIVHNIPTQEITDFSKPKHEVPFNNDWKPPVPPPPENWGGPTGPPSVPQWTGGNMQPWYDSGQMNQFVPDQGMINNNITPTADQSKRKVLPAWIREGLERMEHEKQKKSDKDQITERSDISITQKSDTFSKSKFESGSEAESDAELPQEEEEEHLPKENRVSEPEMTEEEKNEMMMMQMRRMLTEVLLDVTNVEIKEIAQESYMKASRAPAKQLVQSSALSSIGQLGIVTGYSSDEDSDADVHDNPGINPDEEEDSSDEEQTLRKVEAFNKKQMVRLKQLEDGTSTKEPDKANTEKVTDASAKNPLDDKYVVEEDKKRNTVVVEETSKDPKDAKSHSFHETSKHESDVKHSDSKLVMKQDFNFSSSDSSEESMSDKKTKKTSPRHKSDRRSPSLKKKHSKNREKSMERKSKKSRRSRSRSKESSKSKKSRDEKTHSSQRKHKRSASSSPKRSSSFYKNEAKAPEKVSKKTSKSDRHESRYSKSRKNDSYSDSDDERSSSRKSGHRHRDERSERRSRASLSSNSSYSEDRSHKKKKTSHSSKKKKDSKRRRRSSSSDDSDSSSTSSDGSIHHKKARKRDKYTKSHKEDKYTKSHSKRKRKH